MVAINVHKNVGFNFLNFFFPQVRWRSKEINKIKNLDWLFEWEMLKTATNTVEIINEKSRGWSPSVWVKVLQQSHNNDSILNEVNRYNKRRAVCSVKVSEISDAWSVKILMLHALLSHRHYPSAWSFPVRAVKVCSVLLSQVWNNLSCQLLMHASGLISSLFCLLLERGRLC